MKFYDNIGSFIIQFINYVDIRDIKKFLYNCSAKIITVQDIEEEKVEPYYYQQMLLNYLYNYIYFLDNGLERLSTDALDDALFDPVQYLDISTCRLIYLHLNALCQSYFTYNAPLSDDKQEYEQLENEFYEKYKKTVKIKYIEPIECTKILEFLIDNYYKNKFYYYAYNGKIIRLKIKTKTKHNKPVYYYDKKEFNIVQDSTKCYILDENRDLKVEINKNFVEGITYQLPCKDNTDEDENTKKFKKVFKALFKNAMPQIDFQDITEAHNQIISILKEDEEDDDDEKKYCKCCNPNIKKPKATKLCSKCKKLFNSLEMLKKHTKDWVSNDFIYSIAETDFKKMIYNISPTKYPEIQKLRNKRKNILNKFIKKLEREIEHFNKADEYKIVTEKIAEIKQLILNSFDC